MYKINGVIQRDPEAKRTQRQKTLKAEFIEERLSSVAPQVINAQLETIEEENR